MAFGAPPHKAGLDVAIIRGQARAGFGFGERLHISNLARSLYRRPFETALATPSAAFDAAWNCFPNMTFGTTPTQLCNGINVTF